TVGEEHKQQQYTYYQHRDQGENQAQPLKLQVHEVSHDQRRLDDRKPQQHDEHQVNRHRLVSQEDLDERQHHQPDPDRDEQFVTAGEMFFNVCVCSHSFLLPLQTGVMANVNRHDVDQREHKHPDEVDKVPVKTTYLDVF